MNKNTGKGGKLKMSPFLMPYVKFKESIYTGVIRGNVLGGDTQDMILTEQEEEYWKQRI